MNYRKLLKKYMSLIRALEGTDYTDEFNLYAEKWNIVTEETDDISKE